MGKVLINGGGGGAGGSSDEMSANNGVTADLVPSGKTYIGADTDDEIGTGTMNLAGNAEPKYVLKDKTFITKNADLPNKYQKGTMTNVGGLENAKTARVYDNNLILGMTNGAHITNSSGQSYPEVQTPYSTVASKLGVTAAKVANGSTIAGVTGTYTGLGNATQAQVLSGRTFSTSTLSNKVGTMANVGGTEARKNSRVANNNLYLSMTNGAHITNSSGQSYPEVYIPQSEVASKFGVTANKIAYGQSLFGIAGTGLPGGQSLSVNDIFVPGAMGGGYSINNFNVFPTTWPNYGGYDPNAMAWKRENRGDYIYIRTQGGENVVADSSGVSQGCWSINKIIPNTNGLYRSITVVISGCAGMTNVYNSYPFGLCISSTLALEDAGNLAYYRLGTNDLSGRGVQKTITLDISGVTQSFYISFWFNHGKRTVGNAQWQADCYIHKISLVRK